MNRTMQSIATAITLAALCLSPALTACGANVSMTGSRCTGSDSQTRYDWPWYDSIDDLGASADVIVRARIASCARPKPGDTGYDTLITLDTISAVTGGGEASGDAVPRAGDAVAVHGYTAKASGAGELTVGDEYVFFLAHYDDGTYAQLTPALSTFPVTDAAKRNPAASANADGSLRLTDDLADRLGLAGA
ncbi:hypothetical protein KIH79_04505 [Bifidobacterium sp. 82T10]|uniref:Lipoprotein n=1 Tax=Bifidobacterium miconis TaxID=2834435 RepID=A0ABS6WG76_9BIFI|nr:hypothetical protein [Bifidobacterium miconis]MBW3092226.1 hypothetical protein [Bifidobacterium miconis]